jgi:MFS transporter, AAHS family, 3-hydroxyphenylpropionic acid transporter
MPLSSAPSSASIFAADTASPAGSRLVVALCFATAMIEGFDIQAMGVAAPTMLPALGLSPAQAGWAFSASLFGLMLGAAIGGYFADIKGRRPVLILSTLIFGLMTIATALTHDYLLLLAVRVAAGVGLGGAMPMVVAISAERAAANARVLTVAFATAGMPLGAVIAGLLARFAHGPDVWQLIFWVGGAGALVLMLFQFWLLPETRAPMPPRAPAERVVPSRTGVMLLALTWTSIGLISLMLHLMLNWLPTLLTGKGAAPTTGMDALVLFNVGGMIGAVVLGGWVDRRGFRWAIPIACVALSILLLILAGAQSMVAMSLLGLGTGFCVVGSQFTLYGAASTFFRGAVRGRGVGSSVAAGRFGSALGPLVAGQLLALGVGSENVFRLLAPVALLAALAIFLLSYVAPRQDAVI